MKYFVLDDSLKGTLPNLFNDTVVLSILLDDTREKIIEDISIANDIENFSLEINNRSGSLRYQVELIDQCIAGIGTVFCYADFIYIYDYELEKIVESNPQTTIRLKPEGISISGITWNGACRSIVVNNGKSFQTLVAGDIVMRVELIPTRGIGTDVILKHVETLKTIPVR